MELWDKRYNFSQHPGVYPEESKGHSLIRTVVVSAEMPGSLLAPQG